MGKGSAVQTIDLAYVGRGIHEELVAHVADQEGYYEDGDVHVPIRGGGGGPGGRRRARDGSIGAAYVGSTLSPEQVAAEEGFHVLAWVGDHFQIPTVGVVVDPTHIPLDSPALQALARANERALQLIVEKPSKAVDYVAWFLDRLTREEAQRYYEDYVGPYFVPGRTADLDMAQRSIHAVAPAP